MAQLQPLHRGHSTRAPADLQKRSKEGREVHFKVYVGAGSLPSHKADNPWKPWGNSGNRSSAPPLEQKDAYSVVIYFLFIISSVVVFFVFLSFFYGNLGILSLLICQKGVNASSSKFNKIRQLVCFLWPGMYFFRGFIIMYYIFKRT